MADLDVLGDIEESAGTLFAGTHMAWAASSPKRARDSFLSALSQNLLWVAEAGDVIGFIAASRHADFVFVDEMSVRREHQRRGFGRALLSALVTAVGDRGFPAVGLVTDRELPWNRRFYESAGFHVFTNHDIPLQLSAYLMEEVERSRDPARRCAMFKLLPAP